MEESSMAATGKEKSEMASAIVGNGRILQWLKKCSYLELLTAHETLRFYRRSFSFHVQYMNLQWDLQ